MLRIGAACALLAAVVVLTGYLSTNYLSGVQTSRDRPCTTAGASHTMTIKNGGVVPAHIDAKKCDTLTIINLDESRRLVAFGQHDHHVSYDNVTVRLLAKNQSLQLTLAQVGTYRFHDHYQDSAAGTFTVRP